MHLICAVKIGLRRCVKSNGGQDFTVMDAEAGNRVNIVDMVCPSCEAELNRIKRTIKTLYVLVKVLGIVVLVMLIAMAMLAFRVMQIEQCNTSLQDKKDNIKDKLKLEEAVFQSLQTVDDKEPERISNEIFNAQQLRIFLRTKRASEKRQKRERKKKRCKNCLPAVQIEGTGGLLNSTDSNEVSGRWVTPAWFSQTDKKLSKLFDTSAVNKNGQIKVTEDGLYIVYAQMTLPGQTSQSGFEIFEQKHENSSPKCVATCTLSAKSKATCFTMKVLPLMTNSLIYIQEPQGIAEIHYEKVSTVFGMIRIGDISQNSE